MSDGGDGGGNTTLRSAMKLYEENGDPTSSLRKCQRVWSSNSNTSSALTKSVDDNSNTDNVKKSAKEEDEEVPLSRRHNEAILSSLSSQQRQLRQRSRRVRPRPSSFDDDEEDGATNNNTIAAEKKNDDTKLASTGDNNNNNTEDEEEEEEDLISLLRKMWTLSIQQVSTSTAAAAVFIEPQKYCNLFTSMAMDNNSNNNSNSGNNMINNEYEHQRIQLFTTSYNLSLAKYASGKYIEVLHILLVPLVTLMDVVGITTPIDSSSSSGDNNDNGGGEGMVLQFKEKDNNNNGSSSNNSSSKKNNKCIQLPLNSPIVKSLLSIMTRATFLLLDCILNTHVGNGRGLEPIEIITTNDDNVDGNDGGDKTKVKEGSVSVNDILDWIEDTILVYGKQQQQQQPQDDEILKADEVKFKLHLYRSRVLLQGTRGCNDNKITLDGETRAKLARKELKNAMDIYQNKLCVFEDNSGGGGGGSSEGERKGAGGGGGGGSKRKQNQGGKGGYGGGGNNHNQQDTSETTSVSGSLVTSASDGLWKEGKGGVVARATFEGMPNNKQQQQQQSASSTSSKTPNVKVKKDNPGLHVRHESALYMKANLEFLRGNTTKSLKLCAEARAAGKKSRAGVNRGGKVQIRSEENGFAAHDNAAAATSNANVNTNTVSTEEEDLESQMANDYDEAIYYNNLAMVHQSAGKIHVALHYYSYAISYMENVQMPDDNFFWSDGVARPNVTPDILNNASLCAFQTHDYKRAYECMAQCVTLSPDIFGERARCWLRMAQSLIGRSFAL